MTNVSKNMLFAFLVAVSATVLSLGAFATTVHADDYGFGADMGGYSDFTSFGGGYSDFTSYGGGYSDFSSYGGGYGDYESYGGGYSDFTSYGGGYGDFDSYGGGYSDFTQFSNSYNPGFITSDSYNPGTYDIDSYNPGWYDTDSYNPGTYDTDSYNPGWYETDSYVADYLDSYAMGNPIMGGGSFGGGSFGGGSSYGGGSYGGGYSMPRFTTGGGCVTCHSQSYPVPVPKPTPSCSTCGGSNTNITNVNTNTNTYIDNSINDSFNTVISNSGNTTILAPVVPQQQIVYQQQIAAPYCVITLQNAGAYTAQATLVWSSSNATSAYINGLGTVAPNGTRVVTGFANQTYSLTVTGQGGTYTCISQPFTPTYVPPTITPSVSLTQIPYTGLALSPMAQAMYWLALLSVAAAGGYLLVYYKGGALALAGVMNRRQQDHFVVSEQETEEIAAPEAVETEEVAAAPVVDAMSFLPAMQETKTRDIMSVVRSADGAPRIVIARA